MAVHNTDPRVLLDEGLEYTDLSLYADDAIVDRCWDQPHKIGPLSLLRINIYILGK